ncbi:MAG: aminotransferase class I/II-fold pyridoxal phosphate-dependent enzyme, partial [Planctomycetota bacterium]
MAGLDISGIRRIFNLVQQMKNPVDLSLGQAHYDAPPAVVAAARKAMEEGHNRYSVTQGLPQLHERLRPWLKERFGWRDGGTLITSGCTGGLLAAFMCLINKGDEVILPDPYFALYCYLIEICEGKPVLLDTYPDFRVRAERLEALVTERTKVILINTPSNPTGVAY